MARLNSNHIYELNLVIDNLKDAKEPNSKKKVNISKVFKIIFTILTYLFLVFCLLIALLPFYWMIITSLKSYEEVISVPPTFYPSEGVYFINFVEVFKYFDLTSYLGNTFIVIIISTIGTLILTILAAFAFARLEFKGRDALFVIFLATMMIPSELFVITNYITVYKYGLLDGARFSNYLAIMLPYLVNVFFIYLLRQNFKQIPNELYLASKVDGKGDFTFLFKVMVPIASPTIITIIIMKVISTWNAYAWPNLIAITTPGGSAFTLVTVGLSNAQFVDSAGMRQLVNIEMAAAFLVTIPLILLFILFRKYIMRGASKAGIKG